MACASEGLGRSEVLRSLRPRAQSQGHHTNDPLEERGVEKGSTRRSSLKGRVGHRQSDEHWNCFKGDVGETSKIHVQGILTVQTMPVILYKPCRPYCTNHASHTVQAVQVIPYKQCRSYCTNHAGHTVQVVQVILYEPCRSYFTG